MNKWLKNSIIYQIYPQSFFDSNCDGIGDLDGIAEKLPYVKSLGVDVIWLNPVFCSPFMDAGYDVTDFYCVDKRYGDNKSLADLVSKAHQLGLKVVLDLVAGHTSDRHPWFLASKLAEKNEFTNRYIWTNAEFKQIDGMRTMHGMSDRCGAYAVNFFNHQPALNYGFAKITEPDWQLPVDHPDCVKMRQELKNIMAFWFDLGVDGFRVDMASSLIKNDEGSVETIKLWQEIRRWLDEKYPDKVIISEWSQPDRALKAGFDVDFYIFFHVKGYNALFNSGENSFFDQSGKGDVTVFTDEYVKLFDQTKDLGYMSIPTGNHDIERMSYNRSDRQIRLAYSFILTMPGVPEIYYGDELGMRYQAELASKEGGYHRTGSRTPMQWDGSSNAGFSVAPPERLYLPVDKLESRANVEVEQNDENSLLNFVKTLIKLRKDNDALGSDGSFGVVYAEKNCYPLIYSRQLNGEKFIAVVNPSDKTVNFERDFGIDGVEVFRVGEGVKVTAEQTTVFPQSFSLIKISHNEDN